MSGFGFGFRELLVLGLWPKMALHCAAPGSSWNWPPDQNELGGGLGLQFLGFRGLGYVFCGPVLIAFDITRRCALTLKVNRILL